MHHRLLIVIFVLIHTLRAGETIPATGTGLTVEGRCLREQDGLVLGHPGSTVQLRFSGTRLDMHAETTSHELYLDLLLDDRAPVFLHLHAGDKTLPLAEGLPAGEHRVTLVKRGDANVGKIRVRDFSTDGRFLAAPALPEKRLLCLGDSFTCGQGTTVRGNEIMAPEKARRQNGRLAYPYLVSRSLGLQLQIVGCAGRGLLYDWQGLSEGLFAPAYYELIFPEADSPRWDTSSYVPDIIVICIGSNDFDKTIPEQENYISHYTTWLRKIRQDAPHARIVLMNSPILQDLPGKAPKRSILLAYLRETAVQLKDPAIEVFEIPVYPVIPGDWHPDALAHEDIASRLQNHLQTSQ